MAFWWVFFPDCMGFECYRVENAISSPPLKKKQFDCPKSSYYPKSLDVVCEYEETSDYDEIEEEVSGKFLNRT